MSALSVRSSGCLYKLVSAIVIISEFYTIDKNLSGVISMGRKDCWRPTLENFWRILFTL